MQIVQLDKIHLALWQIQFQIPLLINLILLDIKVKFNSWSIEVKDIKTFYKNLILVWIIQI